MRIRINRADKLIHFILQVYETILRFILAAGCIHVEQSRTGKEFFFLYGTMKSLFCEKLNGFFYGVPARS